MTFPVLCDGPDNGPALILAHGAGAPMDSPFMAHLARGLGEAGWRVVRFEFPYMARRRAEGGKRPPDRAPVLLETFDEVVARYGGARPVVAGKSMGGRMATVLAAQRAAAGQPPRAVVVYGYPFHPAGRPERLPERLSPLQDVPVPTLICQGERDSLGNRETVTAQTLPAAVQVRWLPDGDHSLKPRVKSGHTEAENLNAAVAATQEFLERIAQPALSS